MRNTQLACFFDTGCLAKNVISCTPGVRLASSLVPQEGFDRTYRNQSRSVDGWSNVTKASSLPGGSSAITSFGHSKRGLLYPATKEIEIVRKKVMLSLVGKRGVEIQDAVEFELRVIASRKLNYFQNGVYSWDGWIYVDVKRSKWKIINRMGWYEEKIKIDCTYTILK